MNTARIACLQIGNTATSAALEQLEGMLAALPDSVVIERFGRALAEPAILAQLPAIVIEEPDLLLLAAMHGGSARALTMAATKSGLPTALWCHDEHHSLASSALAGEALRQLDHPHLLIHGPARSAAEELSAAAAGAAVQALTTARIGQVGYLHPNLISAAINPLLLQAPFGAWVVLLAVAELKDQIEHVPQQQLLDYITALRANYQVDVADDSLAKAAALHLALDKLSGEQQLDAITVNCWQEIVPVLGVSPCLGFAGDDYRIACEGDLVAAITMIAGEAMSGTPGFVGDLCSYHEETGVAKLMHCGAHAELHSGSERMAIVQQPPPAPISSEATVVACHPVLTEGPAVIILLHGTVKIWTTSICAVARYSALTLPSRWKYMCASQVTAASSGNRRPETIMWSSPARLRSLGGWGRSGRQLPSTDSEAVS